MTFRTWNEHSTCHDPAPRAVTSALFGHPYVTEAKIKHNSNIYKNLGRVSSVFLTNPKFTCTQKIPTKATQGQQIHIHIHRRAGKAAVADEPLGTYHTYAYTVPHTHILYRHSHNPRTHPQTSIQNTGII